MKVHQPCAPQSHWKTTPSKWPRPRALKLGQAISELIRRGGGERLPVRKKAGVWVFELPPDAPRVTSRQVRDLLEDAP